MKQFNTTGVCIPSKHYMADLSERIAEIQKLVDDGKYVTINRGRQYGKTTTLDALGKVLSEKFILLNLDFQDISDAVFKTEGSFVQGMCRIIDDAAEFHGAPIPEKVRADFAALNQRPEDSVKMDELFRIFMRWFQETERNVVLIIDETDSAANHQVFLDFLAQLRSLYLKREKNPDVKTFQSVILAGVTDIRHWKSRSGNRETTPFNIAADFTVDMSLSEVGIKGMLDEYEADHHTEMDTRMISREIRAYTAGYPFLVSRICQLIDERFVPEKYSTLREAWTEDGIQEAVKVIVTEKNTLFDSLMSKLREYDHLRSQLRRILLQGETIEYLPDDPAQEQLMMYGFIINCHNTVAVSNKLFEIRLYRTYLGESRFADELRGSALDHKPEFTKNGELNIRLIMARFIETQKIIRNLMDDEAEKKFLEEEGREKFLTYLSPIIIGAGTFSIEEQTRDRTRMDVVIHYLGKRYVIEMKIRQGAKIRSDGEQQVIEYLNRYGLSTGYMLSFSFNKHKETGVYDVKFGDKLLIEGIV